LKNKLTGAPEDRYLLERLRRSRNGLAHCTTMVPSHVPVFDTRPVSRANLRIVCNITNGVDIMMADDTEVLVDLDTAIGLKLKSALLEILCGWSYTNTLSVPDSISLSILVL
jgi:hypothetical protein